jgi:hypothetical protein
MQTTANQSPALRFVRVLVLLLLAASAGFSQSQNRIVQWSENHLGSYPATTAPGLQLFRQIDGIEIQGFAVGAKSITLGEPFAADDDWLRDFTVRVKNVSQQTLLSIQLDLFLREMPISLQVVFCYPCTGKAATVKRRDILPGVEVNLVMLPGTYYEWLKNQITRERSLSQITKAEIEVVLVRLPGEKRWISGCVKTFDPKSACPSVAQ